MSLPWFFHTATSKISYILLTFLYNILLKYLNKLIVKFLKNRNIKIIQLTVLMVFSVNYFNSIIAIEFIRYVKKIGFTFFVFLFQIIFKRCLSLFINSK